MGKADVQVEAEAEAIMINEFTGLSFTYDQTVQTGVYVYTY